MNFLLFIVVTIAAVAAGTAILIISFIKKLSSGGIISSPSKNKDRNTIIKSANRRLEQNPKDAQAISDLANLYYSEEMYDKSLHLLKILLDQTSTNSSLDEFDIVYKYAVSALKTGRTDEAYKYFAYARSMNKDIFEINFNLGVIEFDRKNYDKALLLLTAARHLLPDHTATIHYLGKIFFYMGRYKEAIPWLKKSFEITPGDKEILYLLGQSYNETGQIENAYRIFFHLRPDPQYGPQSCLETGRINLKKRNFEKAVEDLEIGLRHKEIPPETRLELLYVLVSAFIKENKLNAALKIIDIMININPGYKDVKALKLKYSELAGNNNLKTYLMSPTSEFVNLCRNIVPLFYPKAHLKITDITAAKNDYVDIVTEVNSAQSEDIVLFRFIRTTASVGDLMLRDLYFKSKDVRAGKSYCLSAGSFTETAEKFVEARTIDLIGNKELLAVLKKISRRE
ncbi:MAG: CDC27 family protein [Spirochaetia bacterium]|jgi:tetratricopeptide (TPR) repeat protein|nr:CDC27 family protein [Spirochaetia bacterium]